MGIAVYMLATLCVAHVRMLHKLLIYNENRECCTLHTTGTQNVAVG